MASDAPETGARADGRDPVIAYFAHAKEGPACWGALVLVTPEGDPLDFIYTEPVTLSPLMLRLLGRRADSYMIGRALVPPLLDHLAEPPALLCFDDPAVLQRAPIARVPVAVVAPPDAAHREGAWVSSALGGTPAASVWVPAGAREPALGVLRAAMCAMAPFGVLEPFRQLREAMAELRREPAGHAAG